jgi:phosphatidylinositol glycan class N
MPFRPVASPPAPVLTPLYTYLVGFRASHLGHAQPAAHRLLLLVFAAAPLFLLLSLRDEALFLLAYTAALLLWARLEGALAAERAQQAREQTLHQTHEKLSLEHLRVAMTLLFLLHVGFFGTGAFPRLPLSPPPPFPSPCSLTANPTSLSLAGNAGNVASISSFYLSPVYRLVPIFSPFLMAALLLLKILLPFLLLALVLHLLSLSPISAPPSLRTQGALRSSSSSSSSTSSTSDAGIMGGLALPDGTSLVLLAGCGADILALSFLYAVRIEGSWLEIGRSITHFVMANMLQVFMLLLAALAHAVLGRGDNSRQARRSETATTTTMTNATTSQAS